MLNKKFTSQNEAALSWYRTWVGPPTRDGLSTEPRSVYIQSQHSILSEVPKMKVWMSATRREDWMVVRVRSSGGNQ